MNDPALSTLNPATVTASDIRDASRAALERAIALCQGEAELARRMPGTVDRGHIYYWRRKAVRGVPPEHCFAIAAAVGNRVTVHELRPDIFGSGQGARLIQHDGEVTA